MGMEWRLLNALFVVVVSEAFVGVVGSRVRCFFFLRCVSLMAVVVVFVDIGVVAVVVAFVVVLAVGWRCWLLPLLSFCVSMLCRRWFCLRSWLLLLLLVVLQLIVVCNCGWMLVVCCHKYWCQRPLCCRWRCQCCDWLCANICGM